MSQLESWDPKPEAPPEVRGDYQAIDTATPAVQIGQYLPRLARQTERLAIVRSVRHRARDHRQAAYWTMTGVHPIVLDGVMVSNPVPPSRADRPCLGSMLAHTRPARPGFPPTITLPYPIAERGLAAGQNGGFLGVKYDPLFVRPASGKLFGGVSPLGLSPDLRLPDEVSPRRLEQRRELLAALAGPAAGRTSQSQSYEHFHGLALDMLLSAEVRRAFDLEQEPARLRDSYGDHIFGQSVLLARRLTEAGVPLVTVNCAAGDLNGGFGDIWDTHFQNHARLKDQLMPPFDTAAAALLDDLADRGTLAETLVVLLTEFGRSPLINPLAGRDHWPDCYSVALAGGGIRGGQVYGRSDRLAATVKENPCGPNDLHATVFHAMGIDPAASMPDAAGHTIPLTDGRPLPLF